MRSFPNQSPHFRSCTRTSELSVIFSTVHLFHWLAYWLSILYCYLLNRGPSKNDLNIRLGTLNTVTKSETVKEVRVEFSDRNNSIFSALYTPQFINQDELELALLDSDYVPSKVKFSFRKLNQNLNLGKERSRFVLGQSFQARSIVQFDIVHTWYQQENRQKLWWSKQNNEENEEKNSNIFRFAHCVCQALYHCARFAVNGYSYSAPPAIALMLRKTIRSNRPPSASGTKGYWYTSLWLNFLQINPL